MRVHIGIHMSKIIRKFILLSAILMVLLQFSLTQINAQSATGVSKLVLAQTNATIYPSNSLTIPFNVTLVSGTAGLTSVRIIDSKILNDTGITASINNASGTPNFRGALHVTTNTSSNLVSGSIILLLQTTGADTSQQFYTFTLNIKGGYKTPPSTISTSTTSPSTVLASSTIAQAAGSQNTNLAIGAIIAIIIIIVIIVLVVRSRRHY